jgi:hypothetical protein
MAIENLYCTDVQIKFLEGSHLLLGTCSSIAERQPKLADSYESQSHIEEILLQFMSDVTGHF